MLLPILFAAVASGTVPDTYGSGARLIGMGGGGIAVVEDGYATNVNPARLYHIRQPTITVGMFGALERFEDVPDLWWDTNRDGLVDDRDDPLQFDAGVDDVLGSPMSAGRNIGGKFGLGLSAFVPTKRLFRLNTFEPTLPNYFMYDNRPQRYTFSAGFGGQVVKGVAVGAAIDFVPRAHLDVALTVDATIVGVEDENGEVEDMISDIAVDVHELDLDLVPGFAPIVGMHLDFGKWHKSLEGLSLAAVYRGSVGLPISVDLDIQANVSAEDIGSLDPFVYAILLDAGISLFDHYVPSQFTLGTAYKYKKLGVVYADARWTNWAPMVLNVARVTNVTITAPTIDVPDDVRDANDYDLALAPTWSFRTGAELALPRIELDNKFEYAEVAIRTGFSWEPSPLESQGSNTAILDADRFGVALGLGIEHKEPFGLLEGPMHFDAYGQFHVLASGILPRSAEKPTAGYPVEGTGIPIGGHIGVAGVEWGFAY